jgi:hypothetical protein
MPAKHAMCVTIHGAYGYVVFSGHKRFHRI